MRTLKRAVIILALFIPFSLIFLPIMLPLPSFFSVQPAEAYTYQDVENTYNKAKQDYPNDKIWIEEVSGGYKIWKRPDALSYKSEYYVESNAYNDYGPNATLYACDGTYFTTRTQVPSQYGYVFGSSNPGDWSRAYEKNYFCNGNVTKTGTLVYLLVGVSNPCLLSISYSGVNCKLLDVLLAEFIPVDLCLDKLTGSYVPCLQNCQDPVTGAPAVEICGNGIDDNCNGQIDEGCCEDKDGDGYYAYDSAKCTEGNDCDDNDPTITVLQINSFTADKTTTNPSAGETVTLSGAITGGGANPSWTITIGGNTFTGTGNPSITWDGKDSSGTPLPDGTYTAALSVSAGTCTQTRTVSITIQSITCNKSLQSISGSVQTESIKKPLSQPFTIKVTDCKGIPKSGITINWQITGIPAGAAGQTLTASNTTTVSDGTTGVYLILGSRPGTYTVTATCPECTSGSPQTFTATAVGYTMQYISGDGQTGSVGQALKEPFIVIVKDKDNMIIAGAGIQWNITSTPPNAAGVGLTNTMLSTGSDGMASATLILGDKEGQYTIESSCEECSNGSPVTFTATAIGVKIELTLSKSEALPDENITVTVKATKGVTGEPEPNYPIALEDKLEPKGHDHSNDPPQWNTSGVTDTNGILTKTYSKSISGNVTITAISAKTTEIRDSKELTVWINLAPLSEGTNYILTGVYNQTRCNGTTVTSRHSLNHYGTTTLNNAIINIANDYATLYPGVKLRINDTSLQLGGLFDIYNNYQPPHSSHRFGRNADIESAGVNGQGQCVSLDLAKLYQFIRDRTKNPPKGEGNHYHITVK